MKRKDKRRAVKLIRHIRKNLPFFCQLLGIYCGDLSKIRYIDQDVINLYGGMQKVSDDWLGVSFDEVTYYHGAGEEMIGWKFYKTGNVYNCCIDCIEWLIKEGYFNKEYLV